MRVKTAAKVNLALDVKGKLPNGYHALERESSLPVMCPKASQAPTLSRAMNGI